MLFCPMVSESVVEFAYRNSVESTVEESTQEQSFSVLSEPVEEMRVGPTYYRFTRPATVSYVQTPREWISYVSDLIGYVGKGETPERAFEDLSVQIHTVFQTLLRKRPFELDEAERSRWIQLTGIIDLLHYRTTTPITTHEIGRVSFGKISRPHHIEWISGKWYLIEPHKVPGELMSCRTGQWVDAVVRRDPISYAVLEIESIRRISFRVPNESELKSVWENVPEAKLEPGEWVW